MDMQTLKTMFPRANAKHHAVTGVIPMSYFVEHEAEIRAIARTYFAGRSYRVIYRGPRRNAWTAMTARGDATGALLYSR